MTRRGSKSTSQGPRDMIFSRSCARDLLLDDPYTCGRGGEEPYLFIHIISNGKMILRVGDEDFVFVLSDAMKHSLNADDSCFYLDDTDSIIDNCMQELVHHKPFDEPLDDPQEEDITSIHNKGEIMVRLCKKQWRVVS